MNSVHYVSWRTARLLVMSKLISVSYVVYTGKYFFGNHVRLFVVFVAILWILVVDKVVGAQSRLLILLQSFLVNSMRVRLGRNGFLLGRCPLWVWWNERVLAAVVCAVMHCPASASGLGHSGCLLLEGLAAGSPFFLWRLPLAKEANLPVVMPLLCGGQHADTGLLWGEDIKGWPSCLMAE